MASDLLKALHQRAQAVDQAIRVVVVDLSRLQ
jgi:hypothetical protein